MGRNGGCAKVCAVVGRRAPAGERARRADRADRAERTGEVLRARQELGAAQREMQQGAREVARVAGDRKHAKHSKPDVESVSTSHHKGLSRRAELFAAVRSARRGSEFQNVKYLIAGAVAGIVSRTLVSPLEVLATINMCAVGTVSGTMLEQTRAIFASQGVRGFFRGNVANCMKVAPAKGIQFVTFEGCKRALKRFRDHRRRRAGFIEDKDNVSPLSPMERMLAGGVAGMAAAVACYPLETAKTLLTAHPELYSSVFGTLASVARTQGIGALYRGLTPTLIAMFPYVGLDLMVYEQLKIAYEKRTKKDAGLVQMLLMGAAAGSVAQTTCHPLDVVRKRLQLQGLGGRPIVYKHGFMPAMARIAAEEGAPALYRGLAPQYMSVFPAAGVSYIVYEQMKTLLGIDSVQ